MHCIDLCVCCREERAGAALTRKGAAVCSGIILTKLVGVTMLAFSRTQIFAVYYFRMYMALVVVGTFHSLLLLPVLLSLLGTENEEPYLPSVDGDEATEAPPQQVCCKHGCLRNHRSSSMYVAISLMILLVMCSAPVCIDCCLNFRCLCRCMYIERACSFLERTQAQAATPALEMHKTIISDAQEDGARP